MTNEEARKAYNRAYSKKWRENNPDKVKAIRDRFWAKKAREYEALKEQAAKEGAENADDKQG